MNNLVNAVPLIFQHGQIRAAFDDITDLVRILVHPLHQVSFVHPQIQYANDTENDNHGQNKMDCQLGAQADPVFILRSFHASVSCRRKAVFIYRLCYLRIEAAVYHLCLRNDATIVNKK